MRRYRLALLLAGLSLLHGGCGLLDRFFEEPCYAEECPDYPMPEYVGEWVAADEDGGFARVNIAVETGSFAVEVFERCGRGACSWGAPDTVSGYATYLPQPDGSKREARGVMLDWDGQGLRQGLVQTSASEALFSSVPLGPDWPFDPATEADWQRMVRAGP
jgi:hypothetical protein